MSGRRKRSDVASVVHPTAKQLDNERLRADREVGQSETLSLLEETLDVSKRQIVSGTVRVSTRTETYDDIAEVVLDHDVVDVTHVPVGHVVETVPSVRTEGDTTIIPVVEERIVIVKQIYLKEELHIRRRVERELSRTSVELRRQTAVVERRDTEGNVVGEPSILSPTTRPDPAL